MSIWSVLGNFFLKMALRGVFDIVKETVTDLDKGSFLGMEPEDKRTEAMRVIKLRAIDEGLNIRTHQISQAIELVVSELKK